MQNSFQGRVFHGMKNIILREATVDVDGVGLHSGQGSSKKNKPAVPSTGIVFKKIDLAGTL